MKRYKALGILLSAALLAVVLYRADLGKVAAALRGADYRYLPMVIVIYLTSFLLRSWRWGILLEPVKSGIRFGRLFSTIMIGWTANNLLPARAGELVRAYLIGKCESISKSSSLATIVVERILDSFILLTFFFASMLLLANPLETLDFGLYALAAFVVVLAILMFMTFKKAFVLVVFKRTMRLLPERLSAPAIRLFQCFLEGLQSLRNVQLALKGLALSGGLWAIEAVVYHLILRSFGLSLPVYTAIVLLAVVNVGVILPSAPGAFGAFQFFCVLGLSLFAVDESTALGLSVVLQSVMWLPVTTIGVVFLTRIPAELRFRTR
jgi:uncharacterized protein (TIRG00374 family)